MVSVSGPGAGNIHVSANSPSISGSFTANVLGNVTYSIASIKVNDTECVPAPSAVTYTVNEWASPYIDCSINFPQMYLSVGAVSGASYQWFNGQPK